MIAALFVLVVSTAAPAQTSPVLKLRENNQLHANGDCSFQYEITLPAATYTALKRKTPNTAILIRKAALTDQNVVLDGQTGEWVDADSTLKIRFNARGIARLMKGGAWEIPLIDSIDTELVAVAEGTAILTQAAEIPGLGMATNTIRVTMPPGTKDVKMLRSPTRLSYRLPAPPAGTGEAKADIELETKDQVMTSLAKAMSNKSFGTLWTARSRFKNTGPVALRDYRIRFRVAEYAPSWSPWQGTPLVVAGQTVVDGYYPVFEMEKIGRLTGQTKAALEIQYQYKGPDDKLIEESETKEFILLSRNQVYYTSLKPSECVDWADQDNLGAVVLSSFVTHEDPVIQQAAGRIAKWAGGTNATGSDEEAIKYMAAVYSFMAENIAYQTPPFGENKTKFIQHVKYGRDVLKNKAGTCIDLAILFGSLCQAVGLEPVLYNIPGHTFPAVRLPNSKKVLAVEATLIGRGSFLDAVKRAEESNMKQMRAGDKPYTEVWVAKLQKNGAVPMDLPGVGEDPLEKWGIKMPKQLPGAGQKGGENPGPRPVASPLVGTWTTVFNANGVKVAGLAIFQDGGGFEGVWVFGEGPGRRVVSDTGTWSVDGNDLTIKGNNNGTVVRRFETKGDVVRMELKEFKSVVIFNRKKQ